MQEVGREATGLCLCACLVPFWVLNHICSPAAVLIPHCLALVHLHVLEELASLLCFALCILLDFEMDFLEDFWA